MTNNGEGERPLPDGWVWTTIGEAAKVNYRNPLLKDLPDDLEVTFVPMVAVNAEKGEISEPEIKNLHKVRKGYTPFMNGDVIFAKITPCMENGKSTIAKNLRNGLGFGSTEFHVLTPQNGVIPEWLFYYVRQSSFKEQAKANFSGTAGQLRVKSDFLVNYRFPLAPLLEQKRIVAEIEKQFTRLDTAVSALKRLQTNLTRYKTAVLKAACEGRLVPQNPNDETAEKLLQHILAERRRQWETANPGKKYQEPKGAETAELPKLPPGWVWAKLEQLSGLITSGSRGWKEYYGNNGAIFIRAQDIKTDKLNLNSVAHVELPESVEGTRSLVQQYDLLITVTGANVTKTALVTDAIGEAYVNQHVGLVRPINCEISHYLHLWIISPTQGRKFLTDWAYGAGKPGLSLENLRDLYVALPSLSEQHRITVEVDRQFSIIEAIETVITSKLNHVERLRQAILHRAFTGQLVPQDPTDEPASVLLANIQTQKSGTTKSQRHKDS